MIVVAGMTRNLNLDFLLIFVVSKLLFIFSVNSLPFLYMKIPLEDQFLFSLAL